MTISVPFAHRRNPDASIDSICTSCFQTIASEDSEDKLIAHEERHACSAYWQYWLTPLDPQKSTYARPAVQRERMAP